MQLDYNAGKTLSQQHSLRKEDDKQAVIVEIDGTSIIIKKLKPEDHSKD